MREIKFRAWHKLLKRFLHDYEYYIDPDGPIISGIIDVDCITNFVESFATDEFAILEQYTGLKDKNGKEVFEGDIVRICRSYGCGFLPKGSKAKIEFDEKELCYKLRGRGEFRLTAKKELEVIGNIHENKELME